MSAAALLTMGLAALSPDTRRRIHRDARLLAAWWIVVGVVASAILHDAAAIRSPLWRYPITAALMYVLGDVVGLRVWLALFARAAGDRSGWRLASVHEHGPDGGDLSSATWIARALVGGLVAFFIAISVVSLVYSRQTAGLVVAAVGAVFVLIGLLTWPLPVALSQPVVMAELAQRFVFGTDSGRGILPPLPRRESWATIVRQTWSRGAKWLVIASVAAATLTVWRPGAESLVDAFR